ncbi:prepilin peptidase [Carnobacterium gallinarum]|uniref:prepilin peptidase n=1 Tax=Carnobacterium gallinarum TaxID=2749 RepID=UPI00068CB821|nr:A24 family peptidase [Carnobacterium gallinarum]
MDLYQMNVFLAFTYVYVFILGMCMGSFFLVVGYRVPQKETIMGRSHCDACKEELKWWHVIPLFSYSILKGKCYFCASKIGLKNPILEVFIGLLFMSSAYFLQLETEVLVSFTFICLLFTISISDYLYQIIPNKVLLPFFLIGMMERFFIPQSDYWWYPIAGVLAGFLPLFLVGMLNEKAIGGGDIKLFAVVGLFIGPIGALISLFLSSVLAIIFYVITFIRTNEKQKFIPFGPAIAVSSYLIYQFTSGQIDTMLQLFSR